MQAALRSYVWSVDAEIARHTRDIRDPATREALQEAMRPHVAFDTELTPYKFHVSEDIYTSILLHGDAARRWRSVMHPRIESKMLSPQDMLTWMIQRFKYAAGSLDILFHDNIFSRRRFKLSLPQTLMYATTFWSYLACVWNTVFLISPIIYLFTGIPRCRRGLPLSICTFYPFLSSPNWPLCSAPGVFRPGTAGPLTSPFSR